MRVICWVGHVSTCLTPVTPFHQWTIDPEEFVIRTATRRLHVRAPQATVRSQVGTDTPIPKVADAGWLLVSPPDR